MNETLKYMYLCIFIQFVQYLSCQYLSDSLFSFLIASDLDL